MGADERDAPPVELITGATRGIGFEVCPQVARGYSWVVLSAWLEEEIGTLDVSINNPAALRRLVRDDDQRQFACRSQGSCRKLVRRLAHRPDVLPLLIRRSTQH